MKIIAGRLFVDDGSALMIKNRIPLFFHGFYPDNAIKTEHLHKTRVLGGTSVFRKYFGFSHIICFF